MGRLEKRENHDLRQIEKALELHKKIHRCNGECSKYKEMEADYQKKLEKKEK